MAEIAERPLVVVAGPTAGGKSSLALRLAADLGGEILSVDSVQLYREADIGSAKVPIHQRAGLKHHLLDMLSPAAPFDAAAFAAAAEEVLADLAVRGRPAVLVGGSNLYLKAILYGLAHLPNTQYALRQRLGRASTGALGRFLGSIAPQLRAGVHHHDRVRLERALEIALCASADNQSRAEHGFRHLRHPAIIVLLCWERACLYERIAKRSEAMLQAGLLRETARLIERYGPELPLLNSIGYAQARSVLAGHLAAAELAAAVAQATRRLARQQLIFWRNEPAKRGWRQWPQPEDTTAAGLWLGGEAVFPGRRQNLKGFWAGRASYQQLLTRLQERLEELSVPQVEVWQLQAGTLLAELE